MNKIIISTSNYCDSEIPQYCDKIRSKYSLNTGGSSAYIETDDTLGEVVDFFIENVYPRIVVSNDNDLGLCITIYDGYIE